MSYTQPPRLFAFDTCRAIRAANPSIKLLSVPEWTKAKKTSVSPNKSSALILPPKLTNPIPTTSSYFNNNPVSVNKSVIRGHYN